MTAVLFSIKPKYVEAMGRNEKHYEFRRTIFDRNRIDRVIIYSTSPVKMITATFRVGSVVEASPSELWTRFGDFSGLSRDEFFQYYDGKAVGFAIEIEDFEHLEKPIDPYRDPSFSPPQSFQYVELEDYYSN